MHTTRFAVSLLALTMIAGTAIAQRLPDPPPPPKKPDATQRLDNLNTFLDAYRRSGNPRMVFFTEVIGGDSETAAGRLGSRLEDLFRDPEVVVVNPAASNVMTAQQVEALARNDEFSAARMLGGSAQADVVVYLRLRERRGAQGKEYAASYTIADLRRGTTVGSHAWDMTPDEFNGQFDSYRMAEYAEAIGHRIARQYAEAYPESGAMGGMRRFTLRLLGDYADEDLTALRDALETIDGVRRGSVQLRAEDQSRDTQMASFDIMYARDLIDLRRDVRIAAVESAGMQAEVIDAREGVIDLRLAPSALTDAERALSGGPDTGRNRIARERFRQVYADAGRPTMAVMVNRAAYEEAEPLKIRDDDRNSPIQQGDGTNIFVTDRVNVGPGGIDNRFLEQVIDREIRDRIDNRAEQTAIDLRLFEDRLVERFVRLGVTPRDVAGAQSRVLSTETGKTTEWTDRTLAYELGKEAKADIVLSGVGRVQRDRVNGRAQRVTFAVRAYDTATGDILAATTVEKTLSTGETPERAIDELAAEATGKLAAQLASSWSRIKDSHDRAADTEELHESDR